MLEKIKQWWTLDQEAEENSADNPLSALSDDQRRNTGPLLALAFGWGFLVTGLFTGTQLGNGIPFWPDIIYTTFLGNLNPAKVSLQKSIMSFSVAGLS